MVSDRRMSQKHNTSSVRVLQPLLWIGRCSRSVLAPLPVSIPLLWHKSSLIWTLSKRTPLIKSFPPSEQVRRTWLLSLHWRCVSTGLFMVPIFGKTAIRLQCHADWHGISMEKRFAKNDVMLDRAVTGDECWLYGPNECSPTPFIQRWHKHCDCAIHIRNTELESRANTESTNAHRKMKRWDRFSMIDDNRGSQQGMLVNETLPKRVMGLWFHDL